MPCGRYFSADFGLVHLVAIDLNFYYGVDPCGDPCRQAQLAWLKKDLAAAVANRKVVPWIVVMSHYPFYCTGCNGKQMPSKYYASNKAEYCGNGIFASLVDVLLALTVFAHSLVLCAPRAPALGRSGTSSCRTLRSSEGCGSWL